MPAEKPAKRNILDLTVAQGIEVELAIGLPMSKWSERTSDILLYREIAAAFGLEAREVIETWSLRELMERVDVGG